MVRIPEEFVATVDELSLKKLRDQPDFDLPI